MKSKVFFTNLRTTPQQNIFKKIDRLVLKAEMKNSIAPGDLVAVKLHFGEKGNTSYVKPIYLRKIVDKIREFGGKPFLADTNTLYAGSRKESVSHIETALGNGFDYSVVNAPIIIADGLRGKSYEMVRIDRKWYQEVDIASEIYNADSLIAVTHVKCHELSGIGGVIKNIGMGCASLKGKLNQHSNVKPFVAVDKCTGCMRCIQWCPVDGAIIKVEKPVASEGKLKVKIVSEICIGCGECILPCRDGAIKIKWDADTASMQEKMVEHVYAALQNKKGKYIFISFLTQISPACDCYPASDTPVVGDIGILASKDPVAIDQAAADLINKQTGNRDSKLKNNFEPGEDKFRGVYPEIDWTVQLKYGEEIGLGSREYELIEVS
ncbi:MAG: DUF362 domain-containing protein [Nitrospinae bacterium]|nr:DUF362 domain-containing protein [Nitrospinota bacterium]